MSKIVTRYAWEEKEQFPSGLRITKPIRFDTSTVSSEQASNGTASTAIAVYSSCHRNAQNATVCSIVYSVGCDDVLEHCCSRPESNKSICIHQQQEDAEVHILHERQNNLLVPYGSDKIRTILGIL